MEMICTPLPQDGAVSQLFWYPAGVRVIWLAATVFPTEKQQSDSYFLAPACLEEQIEGGLYQGDLSI